MSWGLAWATTVRLEVGKEGRKKCQEILQSLLANSVNGLGDGKDKGKMKTNLVKMKFSAKVAKDCTVTSK
jgi:hypothetical protein